MNFKPFCINIENMSEEQVKEIFDKTVNAGAVINETDDQCHTYFGVDDENETMFWSNVEDYSIKGLPINHIKSTYSYSKE